jgi:hypothetical protein
MKKKNEKEQLRKSQNDSYLCDFGGAACSVLQKIGSLFGQKIGFYVGLLKFGF